MAPQVFPLAQIPVTSHAFNADRSRKLALPLRAYNDQNGRNLICLSDVSIEVAVSLNSNDVTIFHRQGVEWAAGETLAEASTSRDILHIFYID